MPCGFFQGASVRDTPLGSHLGGWIIAATTTTHERTGGAGDGGGDGGGGNVGLWEQHSTISLPRKRQEAQSGGLGMTVRVLPRAQRRTHAVPAAAVRPPPPGPPAVFSSCGRPSPRLSRTPSSRSCGPGGRTLWLGRHKQQDTKTQPTRTSTKEHTRLSGRVRRDKLINSTPTGGGRT